MVQARPKTPIQELLRRMPYTLHVGNIPGGRAEFISIQAAIDYADSQGGDWVILIYPGTYDEGDITPAGGANITLKGMGEDRVVIAPVAAPATAVIVSGFTLALHDLIVTAPDLTRPALTVQGGTCTANHCDFNGVGAGDSIDITAGTLNLLEGCNVNCDIELSTNNITLNAYSSNITGGINTVGVLAHAMTLYHCDLATSNIVSAATGATTLALYGCTRVGTVNNSGTGAFTIRESDVTTINHVNAAGTITVYGGYVHTITRAVGSVVWWLDSNTLKVLPCGTITDTVIQWAVNAAGAGDTVLLTAGTYEEAVTLAAGINLVGLDKELCVINIDHATLITMAAGCYVANLTLDVTADGVGNGIGIELNDAACTIHDLIINLTRTDNNAFAIREWTGATARTVYIRNVRITSVDALTLGVAIDQDNKTIYIENCFVDCGFALYVTSVSTVYSDHNLWDGSTYAVTLSVIGIVQMTEDTIIGAISQIAGTVTYRDAHDIWHVFEGMSIQDSLTAGAGGEVHIHAGDYYPPNPGAPAAALTVAANTLVRGSGKATIIHGAAAAANITNLILLNGNNITIKDMKLILDAGCGTAGARPNVIYVNNRTLIWLENLWIVGDTSVVDDGSDLRQNGILFSSVTESKIVNCRGEDNDKHGIILYISNNNTLIGNTCQGNTENGIYLYSADNNTVTGNTCQENTQNGIRLSSAINNILTGNICVNNDSGGTTYSGIYVMASNQNIVTNNQCDANGLHGIYLYRSSYCAIAGNVCNNQNTGDGIRITGDTTADADENSLTSNVCRGNASDGIEIAGGAFADRNIVVANQLLGNTGLALNNGGTNTTIAHNVTV